MDTLTVVTTATVLRVPGGQGLRHPPSVPRPQDEPLSPALHPVWTRSPACNVNLEVKEQRFYINLLIQIGNTAAAKSLQSCLTLCDPIDGRPPGFPVPGILQARTLEWVAISFSSAGK